jgi:hypothetical protein
MNLNSSLAGWVILQAGNDSVPNIKAETVNSPCKSTLPYTWVYAIYGAQDYEDIRIDAEFTNQAGSPSSIGLICHYSESDGWFGIQCFTDGSYNVLYGQWLSTGIADYLPFFLPPPKRYNPAAHHRKLA